MTLRWRLGLTVLCVVVPVLVALGVLAGNARERHLDARRRGAPEEPVGGTHAVEYAAPSRRPSPALILLIPTGLVTLVLLVLLGPVVARVRRLTEAVRELPRSGYGSALPSDDSPDEIGELGRAFAHTAEALRQELDRRARREHVLQEFVSNTSHDLAIPLSVLGLRLGELRGIATRLPGRGREEASAAASAAAVELEYVVGLLRNLAVAARLADPDAPLVEEGVDLSALVARVASRARALALERGLEVDFAVPEQAVLVSGDVTMIEQCVANLAVNAVRHHPASAVATTQGHVAIALDLEGDRFVLRVLDDGPGLPASAREALERAEDRARPRGRGLRIASLVARRHGMTFELVDRPEGGLEARLSGPVFP